MAGARAWILDLLDAERSRWMLRLPVARPPGVRIGEAVSNVPHGSMGYGCRR